MQIQQIANQNNNLRQPNDELRSKNEALEKQIKIIKSLYSTQKKKSDILQSQISMYKQLVQSYKQIMQTHQYNTDVDISTSKYHHLLLKCIGNQEMYKQSISNLINTNKFMSEIHEQQISQARAKQKQIYNELQSFKYHYDQMMKELREAKEFIQQIQKQICLTTSNPRGQIKKCIRQLQTTKINLQILLRQKEQESDKLKTNIMQYIKLH